MTPPLDLKALRALALKAKERTSGKRTLTKRDDGSAVVSSPNRGLMRMVVPLAETEADEGEFIAACSPDAILVVLDELVALRAALGAIENECDVAVLLDMTVEGDQLRRWRDTARAALTPHSDRSEP